MWAKWVVLEKLLKGRVGKSVCVVLGSWELLRLQPPCCVWKHRVTSPTARVSLAAEPSCAGPALIAGWYPE